MSPRSSNATSLREVLNELAVIGANMIKIQHKIDSHDENIGELRREFFGVNSVQTQLSLMRQSFENIKVIIDKEISEREKMQEVARTKSWQAFIIVITAISSLVISVLTMIIQAAMRKQ